MFSIKMQPPAIPTLLTLTVLACALAPLHVVGGGAGGNTAIRLMFNVCCSFPSQVGFIFFFFFILSSFLLPSEFLPRSWDDCAAHEWGSARRRKIKGSVRLRLSEDFERLPVGHLTRGPLNASQILPDWKKKRLIKIL